MKKVFSVVLSLGLASAIVVAGGQKKGSVDFKKLEWKDIKKGKGRVAKDGDTLSVLYIGKFKDGKVFDGNMDDSYKPKGSPFDLTLGRHQVIPGWEKGLVGVQEGTVRKLNIPYKLAYGEQGYPGAIPPKTDLVFTVKIVKITPGK